ncbi:5-hydroxytryptamine receptor 2B-like isoform X2 [Syngnathus scovelli]|uniref:5-hydroxytryptamine receptor 2B-like isoform X2 n=1 Tax=Syngnathus scovelli TaxID=161590 RepID=UPI002110CA04|nr:5-hydroxytryptamine receptor 1-like isoform X2 [Syngnathus scovelli]
MMDAHISGNKTISEIESNPDFFFLVFKCVILIVTLVVGLPGNVWVCWIVFRTKCLQTSNNALLVSLAASDILKCSVDTPLLLVSFMRSVEGGRLPLCMCALQQFIWALCSCVQLFTLASISVERYQAISFPFHTERRGARVRLWILLIWLCGLILAVVALMLSKQSLFYAHCRPLSTDNGGHPDPFGPYVLVPIWGLSLTVIVIHYGRIIKLVRQHRKKVFSRGIRVMPTVSAQVWSWLGQPASEPQSATAQAYCKPLAARRAVHSVSGDQCSGFVSGGSRRALPEIVGAVCLRTPGARERGKKQVEGKLAKRFGYIIIAFTLFWLPMVVILLMNHFITRPDNDRLLLEMETWAMVLTCVQAAVDPLIYTVVTRQFRYELSKMFLSIRKCRLKSVH